LVNNAQGAAGMPERKDTGDGLIEEVQVTGAVTHDGTMLQSVKLGQAATFILKVFLPFLITRFHGSLELLA
jgi:hypothetical protein